MLPCRQQLHDVRQLLLKAACSLVPETLANPWVVYPGSQIHCRGFAASSPAPATAPPAAQPQKKPVNNAELQKHQRAQVLRNLLEAHNLLANEVDGIDAAQVERNLAHRSSSLLQLSQDLRALATRKSLPTCDSQKHMLAFYSLLDTQLMASTQPDAPSAMDPLRLSPSQSEDAADAQLYHDVASGKLSIWEAWADFFEQRYQNTPSLEPLDTIYSQHQQAEQQQHLASGSSPAATTQQQSGSGMQEGRAPSKKGVRMDASGTVLAAGKRKNSSAKVLLRPGTGRITVNGMPYDAYFTALTHRLYMLQPLMLLPQHIASWDIAVKAQGRGKSSQAQAARTAIARALLLYRNKLNNAGRRLLPLMARWDGRRVERKKPGRHKARKSFTYVRR